MDIILSNELLLMQQLNYYLTVHNPFRPIEGFLIDIKTRCSLPNPERLRAGIDDFIDKTFLTDACLLYAPSQVWFAVNEFLHWIESQFHFSWLWQQFYIQPAKSSWTWIVMWRSVCSKMPRINFSVSLKLSEVIQMFVTDCQQSCSLTQFFRDQINGKNHRTTGQNIRTIAGEEIGPVP